MRSWSLSSVPRGTVGTVIPTGISHRRCLDGSRRRRSAARIAPHRGDEGGRGDRGLRRPGTTGEVVRRRRRHSRRNRLGARGEQRGVCPVVHTEGRPIDLMSVSADGQKYCPDCGETKPVTAFNGNASRPDGLQFYCKSCFSVRGARTYTNRRARLGKMVREKIDVPAGHKRCPGCKRILPLERWHRTRRTRDGLASECKDCRSVRQRRDHLRRTFGLTPEE